MSNCNPYLRWLAHLCRIILGVTFIFSGFVKSVDPWGTAIKVQEYLSIYGFESLRPLRFGFSIWLCGAELMMGLMLLFKIRIRLISIFALASMSFFTLLTFLSATWLPVEDCGCFGDAVKLTPWQTFAKNMVLLPLSVVVWWRYRHESIFSFSKREVVCTLTFFVVAMGLGTYCYLHLPILDFRPFKIGVNIYEAMHATQAPSHANADNTVLVYRNRVTGQQREFRLTDSEWQNAQEWEWVETRTADVEEDDVDPTLSEFALSDVEGDATEQLLTAPGRLYMLCMTSSTLLDADCEERFHDWVERASMEHADVVCLTPEPLRGVTYRSFAGGEGVRCYNIDATTLKTMLRAYNGVVVLDQGVIVDKRNCRDM
jgi:triosephosphate isomerase